MLLALCEKGARFFIIEKKIGKRMVDEAEGGPGFRIVESKVDEAALMLPQHMDL